MRVLLFTVFLMFGFNAMAQNTNGYMQNIQKFKALKLNISQLDSVIKHAGTKFQNGNAYRIPKLKPGINYLADGMPCLVPQETTAARIPNAWKSVTIPFRSHHVPIPNPALPEMNMTIIDSGIKW